MNPGGLKSFVVPRRTALICLLLAAVTSVLYWQVSGFEFTNFDEFQMVLNNPYVLGGLTLRGVTWALTTSWFEYWHPLTWLSHMLDCELFGLSPGWHHLVNLGFHVANTLLLFAVLQRMTGALWRSAMVAALFALHPLHVESVAWIAERKDVLSAFFFFLTLWAYVRYTEVQSPKSKVRSQWSEECGVRSAEYAGHGARFKVQSPKSKIQGPMPSDGGARSIFHLPSSIFYLLSLLFFACGLMSKPMLVTLPFVLLLLDYWPLQRLGLKTQDSRLKTLLVEKLPFFALTVASCIITYTGVKAGGSILSAKAVPWGLRLANVPVSYVRYLGKMIWPTALIPFYPMPGHWAGWQVTGAILVLALLSAFVVLRARSAPYMIVGWLLFLGTLVPTIGLVQPGFQSIADRYTYIPSIGIFLAVVWAAAEWAVRNRAGVASQLDLGTGREKQQSTAAVPDVDAHPQAPALAKRLGLRLSSAAFDSALLAGVAVLGLLACGYLTWAQARTWRNSAALWRHCLAVCPDNTVAHYNLGYVLQHSNHPSEAIDEYRATLRLKPDHLDANLNLGIALIAVDRAREATNYLARALQIKPDYARAQGAMGLALYQLGNYTGTVAQCTEAIRLDPDAFGPYVDMARALSALGKSDEALRYYGEALRLNPGIAQIHYYLGSEWMKRGAFGLAAASFGDAVRLAPAWTEARAQLQRALEAANQPPLSTEEHNTTK
jgi:tetratricopeptide (TPR) repeat protein